MFYRYSQPQQKILMTSSETEHTMSEEIFGNENIKQENANNLASTPMGLFCKDKKKDDFQGDAIEGFTSKFCNNFSPMINDVGFCMTKNLNVKEIMTYKADHWEFMEANIQEEVERNDEGNRNSEHMFIIQTNVFDDTASKVDIPRSFITNIKPF